MLYSVHSAMPGMLRPSNGMSRLSFPCIMVVKVDNECCSLMVPDCLPARRSNLSSLSFAFASLCHFSASLPLFSITHQFLHVHLPLIPLAQGWWAKLTRKKLVLCEGVLLRVSLLLFAFFIYNIYQHQLSQPYEIYNHGVWHEQASTKEEGCSSSYPRQPSVDAQQPNCWHCWWRTCESGGS